VSRSVATHPLRSLAIYCADIGSVQKRHFGWARGGVAPVAKVRAGARISALARAIALDLDAGRPVALGLECPLFVPIAEEPTDLTSARRGEGNRAWSAAGGAASLTVGLTETVWILRAVRVLLHGGVQPFLEWRAFWRSGRGLFVWEAFVSSTAKGKTHAGDAVIAVRRFVACLPDIAQANAIKSNAVHSLIGAALLRTGWSRDLSLLEMPCVVIKA